MPENIPGPTAADQEVLPEINIDGNVEKGLERAAVAPEPAVAKSAAVRDPRVEPKVGDVVQSTIKLFGAGKGASTTTVRAVVGTLVAYTTGTSDEVKWCTRERWCEASPLIERYEVLHVAD